MFKTIGEIKTADEKFWNVRSMLRSTWDIDYDLWRMKPYNAGKGYYSYTTNSPRVLADKIIAMLCQANLLIRIPTDKLLDKDRRIASNIERFLYGCLNVNDERMMRLNQPVLRDALAWLATLRGGFAVRVFVRKGNKGETIPEIVPWDLYNTSYGIGEDGVIWAAHTRKATRESVIGEYPKIKLGKEDEIEVIDYWDEKNNAVIVGNVWAKEPEPHELDYCPVFVVFAGSAPSVISTTYQDTEKERLQSLYSANRLLYPSISKTVSDLQTIVRRGVKVPLAYKSADGKKTLDVDIYQVEKGAVIPLAADEDIRPIIQETMPRDAGALLQIMESEAQRGGVPHSTYGELGFRLSGFALSQLQGSITTVVSPFVQAIGKRGYTLICDALMNQFASGGFEPIEVMGRTSTGEVFGYPAREKIKSSDLKADWRPEIELVPTLPKDDAQRYQLANIARMGEPPLLSMDTIRDEILNVSDPDLERDKIEEEWGANIPLIRLQNTFQSCIARGRMDKAALVFAEIKKLVAQMETQLPKPTPAKQPTNLESRSMETPGTGLPAEGEQGFSPEVLPPEATGGFPGGAVGGE
jgi:hypothetical protein